MFPASRAGLAAGEHQGHVEPGLVHTKPVVDSAVSAASLHQQRRHTRRLRHQHRPPSKEPESGGGQRPGGWTVRDSQGRRLHSKHGRALFAQAWQRSLQGTSETRRAQTQTERLPRGSTYSCYICRGVDIRRTYDPPAGCGTENDIPTATRSP